MTDNFCRSAAPCSKRERRCGGELRPPQTFFEGGKTDEWAFCWGSATFRSNRNAVRIHVCFCALCPSLGARPTRSANAPAAFCYAYADAKADPQAEAYRDTIPDPHADPDTPAASTYAYAHPRPGDGLRGRSILTFQRRRHERHGVSDYVVY
jgi:hypothetical protein